MLTPYRNPRRRPANTPFALLCRLSLAFVVTTALHVPWQTALIVAAFVIVVPFVAQWLKRT